MYEATVRISGQARVHPLRKGYAGTHARGGGWSGDVVSRWDDLRDQISAGTNMSMSGLANWTFDIGGFAVEKRYENQDPAHLPEWRELNLRWFQFGAFAPIFRSHGQFPYREIWNIAPEGTPVYDGLVYYNKLRYTLLPYIYTLAGDAYHRDGTFMRPMAMDFPGDGRCATSTTSTFRSCVPGRAGDDVQGTSQRCTWPAGTSWIDFNTAALDGGQAIKGRRAAGADAAVRGAGSIGRPGRAAARQRQPRPADDRGYTRRRAFSLYEDTAAATATSARVQRIPLSWNERAATDDRCTRRQVARNAAPHDPCALVDVRVGCGRARPKTDVTVQYDGKCRS